MNFVSVDVETANWDKSSICQIGWTVVRDGEIALSDAVLIDPETYFDPFNVDIHGIAEETVRGCPTFREVRDRFHVLMNSLPVISYGLFDRAAFDLADDGDPETSFVTETEWINGQKIVRRAWPQHFRRRYRLTLVAETLGLDLRAHDAGSDARVLAEAVLLASKELDMDFDELVARAAQPLTPRAPRNSEYRSLRMEGREDGPLSGQSVCFTGSLMIVRKEAAKLVNDLGAAVSGGVTKKTTLLVVGTQGNPFVVGGKSTKHRRAEELIVEGYGIEILSEDQFLEILQHGKCASIDQER